MNFFAHGISTHPRDSDGVGGADDDVAMQASRRRSHKASDRPGMVEISAMQILSHLIFDLLFVFKEDDGQ